MSSPIHVLGISGSLRRASWNSGLLRAAAELLPEGMTLEIFDLAPIPMYNQDLERDPPAAVVELRTRVAAADGLLIATPEYNYSIPGVLKNAIDWLSRPSADIARVFRGRPVGVIGASPGRFGTLLSQTAWL
ncbi:MAG: NAD(P)H-dependent oxidoreductase, partial [Chloroflexota bacterium]